MSDSVCIHWHIYETSSRLRRSLLFSFFCAVHQYTILHGHNDYLLLCHETLWLALYCPPEDWCLLPFTDAYECTWVCLPGMRFSASWARRCHLRLHISWNMFLPLDATKVEAKLPLINLVSVWLVFFCSPVYHSLSLHASAPVYKRFLYTPWQFIILISLAAFLVQMRHGICWHLNSPRYIPFSNICIRVEPCVTQSFVQLLVPGARDLVFTHMYEPQGTWKRPFHP